MRSPVLTLAVAVLATALSRQAQAQTAPPALDSAALRHSIDELRHARGRWQVETEFLNPNGTVARKASGTYHFEWVIEDRMLRGESAIPDLRMVSGILFYVSPGRRVIEMISVGADGVLWTMTGPLGGETRTTQPYKAQGGGEGRLRFTRYNVSADFFESRMEYSEDDGKSWLPGNHQTFRRIRAP